MTFLLRRTVDGLPRGVLAPRILDVPSAVARALVHAGLEPMGSRAGTR